MAWDCEKDKYQGKNLDGQDLDWDDHNVPFARMTDSSNNPWPTTTAFSRKLKTDFLIKLTSLTFFLNPIKPGQEHQPSQTQQMGICTLKSKEHSSGISRQIFLTIEKKT